MVGDVPDSDNRQWTVANRSWLLHNGFIVFSDEQSITKGGEKVMEKKVFESRVLPDGHLYCPEELARGGNARFKVIVTFEDTEIEVSEHEIELSAIHDTSEDFLSEEELNYYLNLKEL